MKFEHAPTCCLTRHSFDYILSFWRSYEVWEGGGKMQYWHFYSFKELALKLGRNTSRLIINYFIYNVQV